MGEPFEECYNDDCDDNAAGGQYDVKGVGPFCGGCWEDLLADWALIEEQGDG